MGFAELFLIGVGLSMDAFAVSVCKGLNMHGTLNGRDTGLLALFFGGFQALMPLAGWALGRGFEQYITSIDHWIAFGLLAFIGGHMLWEVWKGEGEEDENEEAGPLRLGELTLLATTTENPSFSVTRQLLSRLHVLRLRPLGRSELMELARRGAEQTGVTLTDEVLDIITAAAHGDARTLLNLVEYAASLPEEMREPEQLKSALPEVMMRHDKDGDSHYELASALIKSIRGSDPDAALYYLACLLEGGEDPRFICRRLILSASEDVGLADPNALPLAVSCQQAVEFVGMPEGFIPLAETVVYLALARKSNSSYAAYLTAAREVKYNGARPVPLHLRNASTQLQKEWGYGKEYKYPHNYPDGWVEQDYLPAELVGRRFYQPRDMGDEARLSQWWRKIHKIRKTEES